MKQFNEEFMKTQHKIFIKNSSDLSDIKNSEIDLVVTSPPYPMIEMWDDLFTNLNPLTKILLSSEPDSAFELMHRELDLIWSELYRVVKDGGIVCINIGDATRTINNKFKLYANSSRIINKMEELGFDSMPKIIWRKTTNSPNKFMGSGMLPSGAYVTLEHEYILIFRKNGKRNFKTDSEKLLRRQSSYFWEERNIWFSDLWSFTGIKQTSYNGQSRVRTAAYPIELPIRLINMFSCYGDTVLDPFLGTGTTSQASAILGRNSIGYEIDESFLPTFYSLIDYSKILNSKYIEKRLSDHKEFILNYKKDTKHFNENIKESVITSQEKDIIFYRIDSVEKDQNSLSITYKPL